MFLSRLEAESVEALGMGGGVGGTNWELLLTRPTTQVNFILNK